MNTSTWSCPCSSADPDKEEDKGPLKDLVKNIITDLSGKERLGQEEVTGAWGDAVGASASKHSKPIALKKAILTVNIDRSSWLYELTTKKKEILRKLEGRFKGKKIKDIRFRIGEIK